MKAIILLALIMLLMVSCTKNESCTQTYRYIFMQDVTDSTIQRLSQEHIYNYFNPQSCMWSGYKIDYLRITDVEMNEVAQYKIEPEKELFSNAIKREQELSLLKNSIHRINVGSETEEHDHTSAWVPILRTLKNLAEGTEDHRELIVCSNLMENNLWLNMYNDTIQQKLLHETIAIQQSFACRIPADFSAKGVTLTIVNVPANAKESELFLGLISLYEYLLEPYGVSINVRGSL